MSLLRLTLMPRSGVAIIALMLGTSVPVASAQPGPPSGRDGPCSQAGGQPGMGCMGGPAHQSDMATIRALFADATITRAVREIPNGVETVTESATPEGVALVRKHVQRMHARLLSGAPIHQRDPLFAELFAHAGEIEMVVENTPKGVRVRETSANAYVVKLIRAHAATVTKFIQNGMPEMHVNHPVPSP